jgi:hypothetical protein
MLAMVVVISMRLMVQAVPDDGCVNVLLVLLMCPPAGFGLGSVACREPAASTCKNTEAHDAF